MSEINQLVEKLKEYHFGCEGGPLENCADYQKLVELAVQAQKERDYFENIVADVAEDLASDEDGPDYEDLPGIVYDLATVATERAHEIERLQKDYQALFEAAEKFLTVFFFTLLNDVSSEVVEQVRTPALVEAHKALNALVVKHEFDTQEEQEEL